MSRELARLKAITLQTLGATAHVNSHKGNAMSTLEDLLARREQLRADLVKVEAEMTVAVQDGLYEKYGDETAQVTQLRRWTGTLCATSTRTANSWSR
jgi:hypothetical protein